MAVEQVFVENIDSEHVFVLQWRENEHLFGNGDAMSLALELEYETVYPQLRALPGGAGQRISWRIPGRWLALAAVAAAALLMLMLPVRSLGGKAIAGSPPAAGQVYVVQSGDTLASIAAQADPGHASAMLQRLVEETGSSVVVPGEHIQIP
jgi:hypothetical protein